jgi:uncharacterized protein YraI
MLKQVLNQMPKRALIVAAAVLAALSATAAKAATAAIAVTTVNLRAGPSTTYPVVTVVPAGNAISLHGCNASYSWCDIAYGIHRGWVSAGYVQVIYRSAPVIVTPAVAPRLGIVVVNYDRAYWERHYVRYPWYAPWPYRPVYPPPHRPPLHPLPPPGTTVDRTIRCDHGACTGERVVTGPAGRQAVRERTCSRPDQSCSLSRTGPRGNSHTRIIQR